MQAMSMSSFLSRSFSDIFLFRIPSAFHCRIFKCFGPLVAEGGLLRGGEPSVDPPWVIRGRTPSLVFFSCTIIKGGYVMHELGTKWSAYPVSASDVCRGSSPMKLPSKAHETSSQFVCVLFCFSPRL